MPIPGDLTSATVTGTFSTASGQPVTGVVTFTPSQTLLDPTSQMVIPATGSSYPLSSMGTFTSDPLICTDNVDLEPQGWLYVVRVELQDLQAYSFTTPLPSSPSTVDISALEPVSVSIGGAPLVPVVSGSGLPTTGGTETGTLVLDGTPYPLKVPGATLGQILVSDGSGNFTAQANPASSATSIDGVAVSGMTAAGRVIMATDATHATWQLPLQIDTSAGDIEPLAATASASVNGLQQAAAVDHQHPSTGLVTTTGTQSIAGTKTFTGEVIVPAPSAAGDAVTKAYADSISLGLQVKPAAVAATVGGESFTVVSGSVTVIAGTTLDTSVSPQVGDYVLVKDVGGVLSSNAANGLYHVDNATTNLSVSRAAAMSSSNGPAGAFVFVETGTANKGAGYVVTTPTTNSGFTYGTNNVQWTQFSASSGLTADGSTLSQSGGVISLITPVSIAHGGTGTATTAPLNEVFAGPAITGPGAPSFRALVAADVPTLNQSTSGTAAGLSSTLAISSGGTGTATGAPLNNVFAGPATSGAGAPAFRPLAAADVPALNQSTTGSAASFTGSLTGDVTGTQGATVVSKIQSTTIGAPSGGATHFLDATGGWSVPPGGTASVDWFNVVTGYSAPTNGTTDARPAIQNAINAAISAGGGVVYIPAGNYNIASTLTCHTTVPVYIMGAGRWATTLNFSGGGADCLRIYDDSTYSGRTQYGGGVTGLTIDGTHHTGTGAAGLHVGDVFQYRLDVGVQNFSAAGDIGVHLDNQYYWTEQLSGQIFARACATHVMFDVANTPPASTATGSFARADLLICIDQRSASNDGVTLNNGAFIYDANLRIRGNFGSSGTALSSAVLRITGSAPSPAAASNSVIFSSRLDIQVECTSNTNTPQTIAYGTPGTNYIRGCTGVLDFSSGAGTFKPSNIGTLQAPGALWYLGTIAGDASLSPSNVPRGSGSLPAINGTLIYTRAYATGGTLYSHSGDFFSFTLIADTTITLAAEFGGTVGAPQRLTVVITQAASGTPWHVTWPSSGSPTTASPNVAWPGGIAPVMSQTLGAVDVYRLETVNGATWYGEAGQAQPAPLVLSSPGGTAQSVTANGQTITTAARSYCPVTNAGAFTGMILQPGTYAGQIAAVVNKGSGTLTFAVSGTSHVATGTSAAIPAATGSLFAWDATAALWYPVA